MLSTLILLTGIGTSFAKSKKALDIIESFDVKSYHPQQFGLRDLKVDITIPSITKSLKRDFLLTKNAKDVVFRLFWKFPKQVGIKIIGMPKGFKELRSSYKNIVKGRLDFIIPNKISPTIKGYKLTLKKDKNNNIIDAIDSSYLKPVTRFIFTFNPAGNPIKIDSWRQEGVESSEIKYAQKGWSHNKQVLESIVAKTVKRGRYGNETMELDTEIVYQKVGEFGFPKLISITTKIKSPMPRQGKNKFFTRKIEQDLFLKDYKINAGLATKFFKKNK